jgi:hypothetical protein
LQTGRYGEEASKSLWRVSTGRSGTVQRSSNCATLQTISRKSIWTKKKSVIK